MGSVTDGVKTRIASFVLARSSDPERISRRATWLRQADDRFRHRDRPSKLRMGGPRPERLTCAAVQMKATLSHSGREYVDLVYRLAAKAAAAGADIVAFPEYSGLPLLGMIPGMEKILAHADSLAQAVGPAGDVLEVFRFLGPYADRAYRAAFSSVSRELGIYIVSGTMVLPDETGSRNAMRSLGYIFGPEGELCGKYHKTHLMPVESGWGIEPGDSMSTVNIGGIIVAVPICMDATYFETFRIARLSGADLVIVPSANNEPYNLWYALRGVWPRVQESQVYGIGASMVGTFAGQTFTGRSAILAPLELSPGGDGMLAQASTYDSEEIVIARIDIPLLYKFRADNPLRFNLPLYRKYLPVMYRAALQARQPSAGQSSKEGNDTWER
ncbi:MAG TPA: nitrilase-related carbon-nitrogen hydrolase [Bacillota bacterium]|nr:nitrilase-related carbon-nitrogen hydrolase [Bacillota bacterium]